MLGILLAKLRLYDKEHPKVLPNLKLQKQLFFFYVEVQKWSCLLGVLAPDLINSLQLSAVKGLNIQTRQNKLTTTITISKKTDILCSFYHLDKKQSHLKLQSTNIDGQSKMILTFPNYSIIFQTSFSQHSNKTYFLIPTFLAD